jgi:4-carboxymuconolactone decarboxylase
MSGTGPRLPVRHVDDDPRLAELYAKGLTGPDGSVLNVFGTLAHHPDLLRRWLVFAGHVLSKNTLPARERELLILRTGWRCRSRYEFGQHVVIGRAAGLTETEIGAVQVGPDDPSWTNDDSVLLRAADELHDDSALGDATWGALTARWSVEQVLDLIATVGNYHLVAMFLNSTRVELDAGVPDVAMPGPDGSSAD